MIIGCIYTTLTSFSIYSSIITNSYATYGGGGIFWIYTSSQENALHAVFIEKSNKFKSNYAQYGNNTATNVISLGAG